MKTHADAIGAFEAKNRFSELLERVGRGAEITITKHDRPVAKLVPAGEDAGAARREAAAELKQLRKRYSLKGISGRELIEAGRR
jgi:prevent-host-death family protein